MNNKKSLLQRMTIPQTIVAIYLFLILVGSVILTLPIATNSGEWTPFIDAVFTTTSAISITGQTTVNTAEHWNLFGQIIVIIWIQIGGIGIMTLWALIFSSLRKSADMRSRRIVLSELGVGPSRSGFYDVIKFVISFTFIAEGIGALLLSFRWIPEFGVAKGIYYSIFHAISAFCNAGFDLFGDSLMSRQDQPYILIIVMVLIMTGGLGFVTWNEILNYRKTKKVSPQTKLVLIMTISLWVLGFIFIYISEMRNGTFSELNSFDQAINSLFMSVTSRTAGYASVNYANISVTGRFITYILMFIGGSSVSTAGGIKVTTFAIVLLYLRSLYKNEQTHFAKRSITNQTVKNALFIFAIAIMLIMGSTFILLNTETFETTGPVLEFVLMEVVSCFSNVGLTMGITPSLTGIGKLVLIMLMFIGRVGLTTFLWSFRLKDRASDIKYPKTDVMIG